ncbi:MAG: cytochrome P450 [Candidatus Marinimicrobia bacterium]|nr:cytochrome P450 [Candidatus Neomarinimicrobiota bacterium]
MNVRKQIPKYKEGSFITGALNDFKTDNHFQLFTNLAKYGEIVRFNLGTEPVIFISNPQYIKYILQENYKNYKKDYFYKDLSLALGQGLVTSEGDYWRQQRKLIQPTFHRHSISNFAEIIRQETLITLKNWQSLKDKRVNFVEEMKTLTLSIISKCLFSVDMRDDAQSLGWIINDLIEYLNFRMELLIKIPGKPILPTARHLRFKKNYSKVVSALTHIIDEKRKDLNEPRDMLDMLILAQDEETGLGMTNQQLIDEVITMFLAGHETTAHSIMWCYYLLNKHEDVYDKFRSSLGELGSTENITMEEIMNSEYTEWLINETMRFFPVVWGIGREAIIDDEIDGYKIPKGKAVMVPILYMHHHPDYWDNPEKFSPDRFKDLDLQKDKKWIYMPFGEGPRKCIGNNFALLEMQIILTLLTKEFTITIENLGDIQAHNGVTTRPHQDFFAQLH